ncbi:MAG TPA: hypothetical protein VGG05_22030 [Pseudonocardiaceae bacterium]
MTEPGAQHTPLDLLPVAVLRRRALAVSAAAVAVGAVAGAVVGVFVGRPYGLVVGVVLGVPLLVLATAEARRRSWLRDGVVSVRAIGTRSVDLRHATAIELLVSETRGMRAVGVLVSGPPKGRTLNIAVAAYSGGGGAELDILALRRLADALAAGSGTDGLVFAELLVAQLRAEAQDLPAAGRPLFRIAATAPAGRLAHRIRAEAVGRFVATLD